MKRGFVSILEMIMIVVVLFVAFNILFPGFQYKSKWSESLLLLSGRDIILTVDRLGKLYEYSFNENALKNFLNEIISLSIVPWSEVEGTMKTNLIIACNCTNEQMVNLNSWLNGLKFNGREVRSTICYTNLEAVNPCIQSSDVLLIWGYKDLTNYLNVLQDYLKNDNGIVEIMDLDSAAKIDDTQKKIFGLSWCNPLEIQGCGWGRTREDLFFKPENASEIIYQSYKFFYHIPVVLKAPDSVFSVPVEGSTQPCPSTNVNQGNFTFRENTYKFWICNGQSVYFDTNNTDTADLIVRAKETFKIKDYNFYLSYIDDNSDIGVIFKPAYNFTDFLKDGNSKLYPVDQNTRRILLSMGNYSNSDKPIPVVVLNGTRTAWIADFTRDSLDAGDDHRQLLTSLILWASNKRTVGVLSPNVKIGYMTSYINVNNTDMYEVYKFGLGLGYPF